MLQLNYDYLSCVKGSEKACWKLDDAMPPGTRLDFSRPFLPEPLADSSALQFLDGAQRTRLNQITGNAYLNLFQFVEEYILSTMASHAHAEIFGDHDALRALARFVDEEVKHQQLFKRYRDAFDRDFGHPCQVLESAVDVAHVIMSKDPIAVMLVTLHIETMTQQHYTDCVRDNDRIDALFRKLLRLHWMEEAQHARIDALELDKLLQRATAERIGRAFDDYLDVCAAFDGLLEEQAHLDVASLTAAGGGKPFADREADAIARSQRQAYRRTFLTYGMRNTTLQDHVGQISPRAQERILQRAASLD